MYESEKWKWSHSVVSDFWDPVDCSLPGSSIHGIFQASVLEWDAIAFSDHFAKKGKRVLSDSLEKPKEIEFVFHPVVVTDFPMDFSSI